MNRVKVNQMLNCRHLKMTIYKHKEIARYEGIVMNSHCADRHEVKNMYSDMELLFHQTVLSLINFIC